MQYHQIIYKEVFLYLRRQKSKAFWNLCFGGTPVKVVCDNLKTGVTSRPKKGEIILNEAYLSLGEYYSTAIMPTGVKKPKPHALQKCLTTTEPL